MKRLLGRFLGLLAVVAFLVSGCAMGLQSIKSNTSPEKIVAVIMMEVEKCDINAEGWKILEIPDKAYGKENYIKFVAYRSTIKEAWGVGLLEESQGMAIILQHTPEGWVAMQFGISMLMEEKAAIELLNDWARIVAENGDFSKAKTYKPAAMEAPKAEVDGTKI